MGVGQAPIDREMPPFHCYAVTTRYSSENYAYEINLLTYMNSRLRIRRLGVRIFPGAPSFQRVNEFPPSAVELFQGWTVQPLCSPPAYRCL